MDSIRSSYDAAAASYAALLAGDLERQPVERSLLTLFAELASEQTGRTADVGSGPGHITAFLQGLGLDVLGIDLSPAMVAQARSGFPEVQFQVGSMTDPELAEHSLAGLNAWLSTIHFPDDELPGVLTGFRRVLASGAPLMLTFQIGQDSKHITQAWGSEVDLTIYPRRPERVAEMMAASGFHVIVTTVFEPVGRPGVQVGCIIGLALE